MSFIFSVDQSNWSFYYIFICDIVDQFFKKSLFNHLQNVTYVDSESFCLFENEPFAVAANPDY